VIQEKRRAARLSVGALWPNGLVVGVAALLGVHAWSQTAAATSTVVVAERGKEGGGTVDWTHLYVEARGAAAFPTGVPVGRAKLMARRGATMDAQRNLLETVLGVQVTANSVMRNFVVESDEVRTQVNGKIRGARLVSEQVDTAGGVYEVVMRVSMQDVAEITHQFEGPLVKEHPDWSPTATPKPQTAEPQVRAKMPVYQSAAVGPYTGLIIDCRGLDLRPAMSPKIRTEHGSAIWGTVDASREYVLEHGIVGYLRDVQDISHPAIVARCGARPLVVRAISVAGTARTDPVLSAADADRVLAGNREDKFLDRFAVAFLK